MNSYNIHERIFNYVIAVITFLNTLHKTSTNLIFIGQATRSVTSMGANGQEADGALTTKDFIHCFTIVRKESKEKVYWLRVIGRMNPKISKEADILIKEGSELVAIISTIIKNTSANKSAK